MRPGIARRDPGRLAKLGDRFVQLALLCQFIADHDLGVCNLGMRQVCLTKISRRFVRLQPFGLCEFLVSLSHLPLLLQDRTEAVVWRG